MADDLQPASAVRILQNKLIDFATMQKLRRFARYWDLIGNSGNFIKSCPLLLDGPAFPPSPAGEGRVEAITSSPFHSFMRFSEWLYGEVGRTDSIALVRLMELLFNFLTREFSLDPTLVASCLWQDYQAGGRHDKPGFLKSYLPEKTPYRASRPETCRLPKRQARHAALPQKMADP
jgi:hypothetical protein